MAVTTVTANEVTGCTKDDDEDKARRGEARQREMILGTQETNETVRERSKLLQWISLPNTGYIYMKAEAEKALGETQRQHTDPATKVRGGAIVGEKTFHIRQV